LIYPKITIVTPSFNQVAYIEETICSVLSQNYPNLEYMIVDGGSNDGSVDIIKKYEKHLAWWVSEPDNGQSEAINKGLNKATGEIFNWLNSDDYYEPNTLHTIANTFAETKCDILCGRSRIFRNSETERLSRGSDVYESLSKTIGWARMDQPETFVKTNILKEIGGINQQLHYLMDREWWVKYLLKFGQQKIASIDNVLVNFRLHENSKSVSLHEKFAIDHDTIFHGLAKNIGNIKIENLIKNKCELIKDFDLHIDNALEKVKLINESLNYYLLQKADYFYYFGNSTNCNKLLKFIDQDSLDEDSKKLYKNLKLKRKFIPEMFANRLRKIKKNWKQ